jgi:CO/xanthine dehydrogenase Mo-binding subunit
MVEVRAQAISARVLRAEDPRILTGRGRYVDDVVLPGMHLMPGLRSPAVHGLVTDKVRYGAEDAVELIEEDDDGARQRGAQRDCSSRPFGTTAP